MIVTIIDTNSKKFEMKINVEKTKIMRIRKSKKNKLLHVNVEDKYLE